MPWRTTPIIFLRAVELIEAVDRAEDKHNLLLAAKVVEGIFAT
jgi:hypothetical protein